MRLKSNYILPLLLLLTLATACSQDETEATYEERQICFACSSQDPLATRSSGTETLPADYKMWVAAIFHDGYYPTHNYYFGASKEKKFAWDAERSVWKGVENQYYPLSGKMDFLAYAIQKDEHKPSATYSPDVPSATTSTFTSLTLDFGNKLDGTGAVVFSDLRENAPCGNDAALQSLYFRHAMAKIVFNACIDESNPHASFIINQITIRNVHTSGVLTVTPFPSVLMGEQLVGSTFVWNSTSNLTSVSLLPTSASQILTTTAAQIGNPAYLPPQPGAPKDIVVELTYSYQPVYGTAFGPEKVTITLADTNWLPGVQYTYTLTCKMGQIKVECKPTGAVVDSTPENIDFNEQYHDNVAV